jgi:hypothetical protein
MQEPTTITIEELDRFADNLHDMAVQITAAIEEASDINQDLLSEIRGEINPDLTAMVVDEISYKMREGEDVSDTLGRLIERAYNSASAIIEIGKRLHMEAESRKLAEASN